MSVIVKITVRKNIRMSHIVESFWFLVVGLVARWTENSNDQETGVVYPPLFRRWLFGSDAVRYSGERQGTRWLLGPRSDCNKVYVAAPGKFTRILDQL